MANYYSIDDFLASETLFPTVFECGSTRTKDLLRVQAVGINQVDVERDAKADLPLWLSETLHKHNLATVHRPNFLGEKIQRRLTAGAACENLRARCLYYYAVASKFCSMDTADVAVSKAVFSSFRERFTKLAEFALAMSSHSQDKAELIQNLSLEELFLYEGTSAAAYQAQAWCFDHDLNTAEFQKH